MTAFGQWTMPVHDPFLYVIDNEIHHRGQGYVCLRGLGIAPPPLWERSSSANPRAFDRAAGSGR